jgi:hypothetical protein
MSAFLVSHKHINTLLSWASRRHFGVHITLKDGSVLDFSNKTHLQQAAEILLTENILSIAARYPDTEGHPERIPGPIAELGKEIRYRAYLDPVSPVTILKACDCYDYQACETDDYEYSSAHAIVDRIRHEAIHCLPEYDKAPWGID